MKRAYWIGGAVALLALAGIAFAAWSIVRPPELVELRVAAGPRGSDGYTLMGEVAQVAARYSDTIRIRLVPLSNSSLNATALRRGQVDLATVEASVPPIEGMGFVADLFPDYFLFVVRAETGARSLTDIAGLRMAVPESGTVEQKAFWSVISHYDISPRSFRFVPASIETATAMFQRGQVDGLFFLSSIRDPGVLRFVEDSLIRKQDMRFLPIDQAAAMALKRPFLTPATIVKGAFNGTPALPSSDIASAALHRILVANPSAPEDAIAELTRVLFENRLDLVIRMPLTSAIAGPVENGVSLPLHPGAQRFYDRDKPSFLQENAEPMAFIVTIIGLGISLLLAARRAFVNKQKNRADGHNLRLVALSKRARTANDLGVLLEVRSELFTLMDEAVDALDDDRVTEEGFQTFSAIWDSVRSVTRERRDELTAAKPETERIAAGVN